MISIKHQKSFQSSFTRYALNALVLVHRPLDASANADRDGDDDQSQAGAPDAVLPQADAVVAFLAVLVRVLAFLGHDLGAGLAADAVVGGHALAALGAAAFLAEAQGDVAPILAVAALPVGVAGSGGVFAGSGHGVAFKVLALATLAAGKVAGRAGFARVVASGAVLGGGQSEKGHDEDWQELHNSLRVLLVRTGVSWMREFLVYRRLVRDP